MKKQKNFQLATIAVLVFAVLFMAIGFATYSQTVKINGISNVSKSKWSTHFSSEEKDYQLETGSVEADSHNVEATKINFAARLSKPGDHHTFTIKVVNDGSFQAALKSIVMSSLTPEQEKYLTYTVTYAGDTYSASTGDLNVALPVGSSEEVLVDVQYVQPSNTIALPTDEVTVNLSAQLNYSQAN